MYPRKYLSAHVLKDNGSADGYLYLVRLMGIVPNTLQISLVTEDNF